jgi:hypothetical protein
VDAQHFVRLICYFVLSYFAASTEIQAHFEVLEFRLEPYKILSVRLILMNVVLAISTSMNMQDPVYIILNVYINTNSINFESVVPQLPLTNF